MSFILKALGSVADDVNFSGSSKISYTEINSYTFGLLIFTPKTTRISLLKLTLKSTFNHTDVKSIDFRESTSENEEPYEITFLNVLCFQFPVIDIVCAKYNIWALGPQTFVDLKAYVFSAFKDDEKRYFMDTDDLEEFNKNTFHINVKVQFHHVNNFDATDTFYGIDMKDLGFIKCSNDENNDRWCVELVTIKAKRESSNNHIPLFHILKHYDKSKPKIEHTEYQGIAMLKPCILFIHHNDAESEILLKIFGMSCPMSGAVWLVGHPNGTILWTICDLSKQVDHGQDLQSLYTVKQPIVDMQFIQGSGKYDGHQFFIVVGSFGQLTIFSPTKLPSSVVVSGRHPFWVLTLHLQSSIKAFAVIQDCLLHAANDGSLLLTDLSKILTSDVSKASTSSSNICNVSEITVLEKNAGVLLLHISTGSTYLSVCRKEENIDDQAVSLPSLLNECLNQSVKMQKLSKFKALQRKLFAAISIFAALKFDCSMNPEPLTFAASVIEIHPGKYILDLNLKDLQKLDLDCDLCSVSASVFSYFGPRHKLISKTAPYSPGQSTFSIEMTETDFQFSPISVFPLLVEVGLILQLPEHWKSTDMWRSISDCFLFYLSIKTFMVHKLQLFENSSVHLAKKNLETAFEAIQQLGAKRPISNLLKKETNLAGDYPMKFSVCLSSSAVEKIMQHSEGVDGCEFILQFLLKRIVPGKTDDKRFTASENSPSCLSVSRTDNVFVINLTADSFESLLGLRTAVLDIIMSSQLEEKSSSKSSDSSAYVNIPASMYRKCEELSKSVMSLFGKDVHSIEEADVIKLYSELRKELSAKLPIL